MDQPIRETVGDERPPVNADAGAPQVGALRWKPSTTALRAYTMVFALIGLWAIFTYKTGGTFLSARNFSNLMRQTSITGVLAVGMLMVIVAGQIDLSIGSLVGLAGGVSAIALTWMQLGVVPSLLAAILVGVAIGLSQARWWLTPISRLLLSLWEDCSLGAGPSKVSARASLFRSQRVLIKR
ncbi:MAG: hypothetical protein WKF84_11255 [Pyrinomonadaceae bacterium]